MVPLSFIRYLTTFGKIVQIVTLVDAVPRLAKSTQETNYLGFEINFNTEADKATIEGRSSSCATTRASASSRRAAASSAYLELIAELPEEDLRLGEILVRCGTLTQAELDLALRTQEAGRASEDAPKIGEVLVEQQLVQQGAGAGAGAGTGAATAWGPPRGGP